MPVPQNNPMNEVAIQFPQMADISTAGSVYAPCPVRGTLARGYSVLGGSITGDDCTWSVKVNGVAVTGTATVAVAGSEAGVVDRVERFTGSAAGVVPGDTLEIVSGGQSSSTATADFCLVIRT